MEVSTKHGMSAALGDVRPRLRVLIADDDRDLVRDLMMRLKEEGYEPHGVYAGRYVVGSVMDIEPDVVVLNTSLTDMPGSIVAQAIRARREINRPALVGISESAGRYQSFAEKILARPVGFKHYLEKPFAPEELLALLDALTISVES